MCCLLHTDLVDRIIKIFWESPKTGILWALLIFLGDRAKVTLGGRLLLKNMTRSTSFWEALHMSSSKLRLWKSTNDLVKNRGEIGQDPFKAISQFKSSNIILIVC